MSRHAWNSIAGTGPHLFYYPRLLSLACIRLAVHSLCASSFASVVNPIKQRFTF
jgi:hypothetical protein